MKSLYILFEVVFANSMLSPKFSISSFKNKQYRQTSISFTEALEEIKSHSYEVNPGEISFGRKLGEGSMAEVFECEYHGTRCAAKKLKQGVTENTVQYHDLLIEVHTLASIGHHPNIVTFYGACIQDHSSPGSSNQCCIPRKTFCLSYLDSISQNDNL